MRVGDCVEMTAEAIRSGLQGTSRRRTGTVTRTATEDGKPFVWVHRDRTGSASRYWAGFWQPVVDTHCPMRVENQSDTGAAYVRVRSGEVACTEILIDGEVMADFDACGRLIGVEVLGKGSE